jgi:hypothetical protein
VANELSRDAELLLICGRYEGVDERVAEHLADEEISIGNYVLSGGELAAAVVIDAVARLIPGVLGNETSTAFESFQETGHGRFSGLESAGSAVKRQSRGDPAVSPAGGTGENRAAAARFAPPGQRITRSAR